MDKAQIGKRVRRQREVLGLTRDEFAERTEISPQFLAEIENGKKGMSAETLYKICERANISSDYILFGRHAETSMKTPVERVLYTIPPQYSTLVEDVLSNFLRTVKMAESHVKEI